MIIKEIINYGLSIFSFVSILTMIYGIIKFIIYRKNRLQRKKAKNMFFYGLIGTITIFVIYGLVIFTYVDAPGPNFH